MARYIGARKSLFVECCYAVDPPRGPLIRVVSRRRPMGNETYLISTATPSRPPFDTWVAGRGGERLLTAKSSIPVFWYMPFDRDSLILAKGLAESGEVMPYTALCNVTSEALVLARSRWPRVRAVLGTGTDDLFERWIDFVEGQAADLIH